MNPVRVGRLTLFDALPCSTCYYWAVERCMNGWRREDCQGVHHRPRYTCPGGLVRDRPVTAAECRRCAASCAGCFEMAVRYRFVERESVQHLLGR